MSFCFLESGLKDRLVRTIGSSRDYIREREPFVVAESISENPLLSVRNVRMYGVHGVHIKEASMRCNSSFLELEAHLVFQKLEVVFDITAVNGILMAGDSHLVAEPLEFEATILFPAEEGSRVLLTSLRVLELRVSHLNLSGPFSLALVDVSRSSGLFTLRPNNKLITRALVSIIQRCLDRVEWKV
ncbi:uncharacterized protein LOC119385172 [Rhipicephalus sanguineus]|uniref:Uncharacterized protein n=1 Tax=Rhipicephalus sanguineus TaxID=34632 RepID=A0A9D4Q2J9_RHISA|nr:uncharacterized protein LOC119385172 [Rhipicephalus sanguineus]KAH7963304.1 hypothetical protein HPB52_020527 [Rhipicephalus sanguineus]